MGIVIGTVISASSVFAMTGGVQKLIEYSDMKITMNGQKITPTDANGVFVEPFAIDGTTYLPVRAVANAMGLNVGWDSSTKTVQLSTKQADEQSAGTVVYDKNGIRITYQGLDSDDYSKKFKFLVENNSAKEITVQARDESINGYMIDGIMSEDVMPGKKSNAKLTYYNTSLEKEGISYIETLEMSFHIYDAESWDTIDDSEIIKINP